jgi:hypothetical protein
LLFPARPEFCDSSGFFSAVADCIGHRIFSTIFLSIVLFLSEFVEKCGKYVIDRSIPQSMHGDHEPSSGLASEVLQCHPRAGFQIASVYCFATFRASAARENCELTGTEEKHALFLRKVIFAGECETLYRVIKIRSEGTDISSELRFLTFWS